MDIESVSQEYVKHVKIKILYTFSKLLVMKCLNNIVILMKFVKEINASLKILVIALCVQMVNNVLMDNV